MSELLVGTSELELQMKLMILWRKMDWLSLMLVIVVLTPLIVLPGCGIFWVKPLWGLTLGGWAFYSLVWFLVF